MFPLSFWDISLWLAATSIILLAASELISPHYGQRNLLINKKRLEQTALITGASFLIAFAIHVIWTITFS